MCRHSECALGNLLADATYEYFLSDSPEVARVKLIDIAVVNGGAIRPGTLPAGNVTFGDIVTVYPYANAVWVLPLTGEQVKEMYESGNSGFMQSSGES